ncbi:MAG: hypothetical protein ABEJ23_08920 [Haloarculaceae archaeon]
MTLDAADLDERFDRLMGQGVYVTDVAYEDGALHVGHETVAPEGVPGREVGRILAVLLDAREDGWEPTDVRGWVFDADAGSEGDRERRGTWRAEAGWFHALSEGYLSETDFSTLVLSTI